MEIILSAHGYGSGDGYGYGYGYGYSYGDGSGDGSGDGYGDGYGDYWKSAIHFFAAKWPTQQRKRLAVSMAEGAKIAYWLSDETGRPTNGGTLPQPCQVGEITTVKGPLLLCSERALHATLVPRKWKGERWWIVALHGEVVGDDDKLGALKREILGECL